MILFLSLVEIFLAVSCPRQTVTAHTLGENNLKWASENLFHNIWVGGDCIKLTLEKRVEA